MKVSRQRLIELHLNDDEKFIFLEGPMFDTALVGVIERYGQPRILCYDYQKVIKVLVKQGMSDEEAVEWFDFNIIGAWMGDETPCFLHRFR